MTEQHRPDLTDKISPTEPDSRPLNCPLPPPCAPKNGKKAISATSKRCREVLKKAGRKPYSDKRTFHVRGTDGEVYTETRKVFHQFTKPKSRVLCTFKPGKNDRAIPDTMSRERRKLTPTVGLFFQEEKQRNFRYAVVTGGTRCSVHGIKKRVRKLRSEISAFTEWATRAFGRYGFDALLTAYEIPSGKDAETDSLLSYHPHANLIYRFAKRLPPEEWQRFLSGLHRYCSAHAKECGPSPDPLALLTYVTKLNEIEQILDHGEYVPFHDQLSRLSTVQFHGSLRKFRQSLEAQGWKAQEDPHNPGRYVRLPKNRRPKLSGPKIWDEVPDAIPLGEITVREDDGSYGKTTLVMKVLPKTPPLKSTYTLLLSTSPGSPSVTPSRSPRVHRVPVSRSRFTHRDRASKSSAPPRYQSSAKVLLSEGSAESTLARAWAALQARMDVSPVAKELPAFGKFVLIGEPLARN